MTTIAPAELQIPAIRTEFGALAGSNTYATDWFRVTGRTADLPETDETEDEVAAALADAVDARTELVRLARRGNSPAWRKASRAAMKATDRYATLAGMTRKAAAEKVQSISECFTG